MNKYCFLCLFRADKGVSGLAFRVPLIWQEVCAQEEAILIVNETLAKKTLSTKSSKPNLIIIPEYFGFKISCLLFVPPVLLFCILRGVRKFHLSVGGAYFLWFFEFIKKVCLIKKIALHTSIGSRSIEMAVGGSEKYRRLHNKLLETVDKVDCLYGSAGFPGLESKFVRSPGSFSWRFSDSELVVLKANKKIKLPLVVYAGTLIPQKNYGLALEGFEEFIFRCPTSEAQLHIFAPAVSEVVLAKISRINNDFGKKIIYVREASELTSTLSEARVFLSLQDFDNYPSQSLIEAMANGCDVIATDVGETRRLVDSNNDNYLISTSKIALCAALISTFSSASSWNTRNAEKIAAEHSVKRYAEYFCKEFIQ